MDFEEEYKRKALEPIVSYIESVMTSYSKEELEARIKKALPEKESEDESIRKWLVDYFARIGKSWIHREFTCEQILTYLEKQKVNTEGDFARGYDCGYECCLNSHGAEWFEKHKEHKPAE